MEPAYVGLLGTALGATIAGTVAYIAARINANTQRAIALINAQASRDLARDNAARQRREREVDRFIEGIKGRAVLYLKLELAVAENNQTAFVELRNRMLLDEHPVANMDWLASLGFPMQGAVPAYLRAERQYLNDLTQALNEGKRETDFSDARMRVLRCLTEVHRFANHYIETGETVLTLLSSSSESPTAES